MSNSFNRRKLLSFDREIQKHLLYRYLTEANEYIKMSMKKVESALDFLGSYKGKEYKLMENVFLAVKDSKIKIYTK